MKECGSPEKGLRFIHLAGTNGKGSTGAMLASCLSSAGADVGFYTSPHLFCIRERFRVNGKAVSETVFIRAVEQLSVGVEIMKGDGASPTFFEATTVLAALCFVGAKVDCVVWETGLGGRFDASNVVEPVCSVLTSIAMDHEDYLGNTLEKIAFEKAGIIKPNKPVFSGNVSESVAGVFKEVAANNSADLQFVSDSFRSRSVIPVELSGNLFQKVEIDGVPFTLSLLGPVQVENATLAYFVLKYLCSEFDLDLKRAMNGFSKVNWPGRFQILGDGTIVDGAHNSDGARVLVESLKKSLPGELFTVVFGSFEDKDSRAIIETINEIADSFIFVPILSGRETCDPAALQVIAAEIDSKPSALEDSVVCGVVKARESGRRIVVAGSLYLAGELLVSSLYNEDILNIY